MSKNIFLFPGQGAQYIGMGSALAQNFEPAKKMLEYADEILNFSLSKIMLEGPEEVLKSTDNTQPALFVTSMMVMELLIAEGIPCDMVAGHSLGEYSAICAAGGFSFEDGLHLVRKRGELMATAGTRSPGKMAAVIGVEDDAVKALCAEASKKGIVIPANFNCPGQVVVSGSVEGVNALVELCESKSIKAVLLPVSGAFHSPLMEFAVEGLTEAIAKVNFSDLKYPLIANVTAEPLTDATLLPDLLVRQITSPVRWGESMQKAISLGVTSGVEVGSGKVLMGLMRRIDRNLKVTPVENIGDLTPLKG
ncbi:MAG TPA: ACP S-malonyltransferase [Fibrobacter sp.]|nr:ACP S-malonyltransferase [Fibrobacter sp.]